MKRSIMTEKIARRGYHIYREYGVDPLERHHVDEVMSHAVKTIDAGLTVRDALATFFDAAQAHRAYPAVRDGAVLGMVERGMLDGDPDSTVADALRGRSPVVALPHETCRLVATRLAVHGLERLPVVADTESRRLVGIVARSDLVKPSLAHFDEEHKRERFRRIAVPALARRRRLPRG
jgi:CBS domain-containing protein